MSEPNPALKENERTQWGWQSKHWQAMGFPFITTSKQNKYWIPEGGSEWIYDLKLRRTGCPLECLSHFRTHEVQPGMWVWGSIQVLLYAYIMRYAFSHREKRAGYMYNARLGGYESVSQCFQSSRAATLLLFKSKFYCALQLLGSRLSP